MKRYNTILESTKEPENKNDLWINNGKLKAFIDGLWKNIIGDSSVEVNEEDLDIEENGKLKFSNRNYNPLEFSGKGYNIIRRNIKNGVNILSQNMINDENTVYEIRYDFYLDSKTVNVPKGSVLLFNGGSISNGTLQCDDTIIKCGVDYVFKEIQLLGKFIFDSDYINVRNYGARGNGIDDDSLYIQKAIDNHKNVYIPKGTYILSTPIYLRGGHNIFGETKSRLDNIDSTILKPQTTAFTYTENYVLNQNMDITISNFIFKGGTNIIDIPLTHLVNIHSCTFQDFTGCGIVIVRGERICLEHLYFTITGLATGNAKKGISLANLEDSIYKDVLKDLDLGVEGAWVDRLQMNFINMVSLSTNRIEYGINCGTISNCSTNNIILVGTLNTPFYATKIQQSIIQNIGFDACGRADNNAEYGFYCGDSNYSVFINISPSFGGNCHYNTAFYISAFTNTTLINCFARKTTNGLHGFYLHNGSGRKLVFISCGGDLNDESSLSKLQRQITYLGCNFDINNTNIGTSIPVKDGNPFIIQFMKDINGASPVENPLFQLSYASGGGNIKSFFEVKKDRIIINYKEIIVGSAIPDNSVSGNTGSIYINTNGDIFIKNSNGWKLLNNNKSGTFSEKPTESDGIDIGFPYFCTDKQSQEGATNGIIIYYAGNNIWVDSLGRIIN